MHILYLDDSGSISIQDQQQCYFVLGGVSIPENSLGWLNQQIEQIAKQLDPINPRGIEFHASEMHNGKHPFWSQVSSRRQIIKDVLGTLNKANDEIRVFACAVHKGSYPSEDPVLMAFEDISSRFDQYLHRTSTSMTRKQGIIIIDKSSYENSFQNLLHKFRTEGNVWGYRLRNLPEVPLFIDSKASRITQLADHIAHAVFRRYNCNDLTYFNCVEQRFDRSQGIIHGLCHKQLIVQFCTCPACATRHVKT